MKMPGVSLLDWQKKYGTEEACAKALYKFRWPEGFYCPRCGCNQSSYITTRKTYQCSECKYHVSLTTGTLFHSTNLPLVKWFWAIYLAASDKGGISALRLSKQIGVSWPTARNMLRKIRTAMEHRDSIYRLENFIEMDDALVGGKKPGKRGRGAQGKKSIMVAVENRGNRAGFMAAKAVNAINKDTVRQFIKSHFKPGQTIRTDALPSLNSIGEMHDHDKKVTPAHEAKKWLPLVHIMIGNLKKFLNGTYHGVSHKYLNEYIAEFSYRFNRRFWEPELPFRLLNACLTHVPINQLKIV
jgi:transposase-like protein